MSTAKELKKMEELAHAAGWTTKATKSGIMFIPADKTKSPVTAHYTPSCYRGWKNTKAELKRRGLDVK